MGYEIVVVGTSWGGLSAVRELVVGLPAEFGLPIAIIQHRHKQSDGLMTALVQDRTVLPVCEVEDKAPIAAGTIYIAPPDYHLLIDDGHFALSTDDPVRYSRPSIDVTFDSAADAYGSGAVGVILTGANDDGASGLKRIFDRGGLALIQLPGTAESPTMPAAALRTVPQARVLTIAEISAAIIALPVRTTPAPPRASSSRATNRASR